MIQHVVSIIWREGTSADDVAALVALLEALPGEVPEIREYRFGADLGLREDNADFAVAAVVDDPGALAAYLAHPHHLKVRAQLDTMTESRRAVQFALPGGEEEVRALYAALIAAWNARDADAMADLYAPDGSSIGFDGSESAGRETIRAELAGIFRDHPTPPYVARARSVRFAGPGVAILRAVAGMAPGGAELDPDFHTHQTLVAERRGGTWSIVLFQNTPARYDGRPEAVAALTAELR